jgi:hypothetical protein
MTMGQQNAINRNACLDNRGFNPRNIAARVYDDTMFGLLIPDQGAVLLEGRDGDDGGGE